MLTYKPSKSFSEIEHYQVSDKHLEDITKEFKSGKESDFLKKISFPKPVSNKSFNVLFMLGDIMEFRKTFLPSLVIKHICSFYDLVLYVPGNHCYYNSSIASVESKIKGFMSDVPHFFLLQNETLSLDFKGKSINYIGSTLWTNFGKSNILLNEAGGKIDNYTYAFSDYKKIALTSKPYVTLKPHHVLGLHNESVSFIESELERLSGYQNIVLSHHSPTYKSSSHFSDNVDGKKLKVQMKNHLNGRKVHKVRSINKWNMNNLDRYTPLFCSDLDYLIKKYKPILWGHGHVHERRYYKLYSTIISCNPTGYLCEQINPRIKTTPTFKSILTMR